MDSVKLKVFFTLCLRIVSLLLIIASCFMLYNWQSENDDNQRIEKNLLSNANIVSDVIVVVDNTEIESYETNSDELINQNSHAVGWIKVNNTDVNYPIVQYTDNEYYLTHNFENNYNSAGWIFMAYRNSHDNLDKNTIIYGHNRRDNSMFGTLKNALDDSWCQNEENQYITFNTLNKQYIAQIFSIYKVDSRDLSLSVNFESDESYKEYLNTLANQSYYQFNVNVSSNDKILTLYTCDDDTSYRILIHAKIL